MLTYAYITLIVLYVSFAELCYIAWGTNLDDPLITQMLPAENGAVILIKFLFSLNLLCSYPIIIGPTNTAVETLLCGCLKNKKRTLYWA